jgi:hypothetical protein
LTLLNDPASFEAARALAGRMIAAAGDRRSRAAFGITLVLSRAAKPAELDRLVSVYDTELDHYRGRILYPTPSPSSGGRLQYPNPELAAWTMVANVLLNLDEAVTKE